jgi:FixJ family two-component response regulator
MQTVQSTAYIATIPRQYRNRPNPKTFDTTHSGTVGDAIYLVGDDPFLRERVSTCPSLTGKQVIAFPCAGDYLTFTAETAAACVIIDSNLPDMSGLEFQCRLASTSNTPVIFISDRCDVAMAVCAMKAGAIDFLIKPFHLSDLIAAIQTGLEHDLKVRQRKAELAKLQARLRLLTPREREVLPLVIGGLLNKQAASFLGISEVTLQIHRSQVMRKMQADSLADLVRMAIKLQVSHWREQPSRAHQTLSA